MTINHLGNVGLEYTFDDEYSNGSRELSDDMALLVTTSAGSYGTLGDVNQDGLVDILDIVMIINITLGTLEPSSSQETIADINSDGIINILDIIMTINIIIE